MKIPTDPKKIYRSPSGRPFKLIGTERLHSLNWRATVRFLDTGTLAFLECDHNDNIVRIYKC